MYCTKCGKKNKDNTIYCEYCGKQMIEEDKLNITVKEPARNNGLALAGFIVGIVSNVFGVLTIGGIVAIILSSIALNKIKKNNDGGKGFALVGLILGIVAASRIIFYILAIVFSVLSRTN